MKKTALVLLGAFISFNLWSQVAPYKYFIELTDKNNSPYSLDHPSEFLSARAIERRQKLNIPISEFDLPVTPSYIQAIQNFGVTVLTLSKWFNGMTVFTPDSTIVDTLAKLPFVKNILIYKKSSNPCISSPVNKFAKEESSSEKLSDAYTINLKINHNGYNYGPSYKQIHMVNGDLLHQLGYRGEGKIIAVLDAGFYHADILPAFDSLRANNQILGTRDFVNPGGNVYVENPHGMEVLSIIGGNLPGQLVGVAPKASFWLLRSEDTGSEYVIEEYNYVAAAEFADSAGADIITSSLGYTTFNDHRQDHTCADMNGNTNPSTRGANMAANTGMIVVSSAGNSGGSSWRCVSSPADGNSVLGIGAVDSMGHYASFSSVGVATTRIKPNLAAMGEKTVLAASDGTIMRASGTSFAAPIIAGMMACLWQAVPSASNFALLRSAELSGSQIIKPDSLLGYGIPDFYKAINLVTIPDKKDGFIAKIFPNPFQDVLSIAGEFNTNETIFIEVCDLTGHIVFSAEYFSRVGENQIMINSPILGTLNQGTYFVKMISDRKVSVYSIIKSDKSF